MTLPTRREPVSSWRFPIVDDFLEVIDSRSLLLILEEILNMSAKHLIDFALFVCRVATKHLDRLELTVGIAREFVVHLLVVASCQQFDVFLTFTPQRVHTGVRAASTTFSMR